MRKFEKDDYKVFDLFNKQWALVTAGNIENYNTCTISWGSMGTIWGMPGDGRPIITVYVHPSRYTNGFLKRENIFTVSFFQEKYRKALDILGNLSGRDGDKVAKAGLTPVETDGSVSFKEASRIFVCRKLYQAPFVREGMAEEINHGMYGDWEPHDMFIGEIMEVVEKTK